MKYSILGFIALITLNASPAFAKTSLCEEGRAALSSSQKYISCDSVDFNKKAVSMDYQSKQTGPLLAKPALIKDAKTQEQIYINENPGIINTKLFFDKDSTLSAKFYQYASGQSAANVPNAADLGQVASLLQSPTYFNEQSSSVTGSDPKKAKSPWEGHCELYATMALDPDMIKMADQVKSGIMCNGIPFTTGELTAMMMAFYPLANFTDEKKLTQFYDPDQTKNLTSDISREDANIALTKLGELGGGSRSSPADVMQMAKTALSKGENMIFDIDPGSEVWNQPIEEVVDITYSDVSPLSTSTGYQIQDFNSVAGQDPNDLLGKFRMLQADLKMMSIHGHVDYSCTLETNDPDPNSKATKDTHVCLGAEVCAIRKSLGQTCDDMIDPNGRVYDNNLGHYVTTPTYKDPPLSQQVDEMWKLETAAVQQGALQIHAPPIEHHKILIRYGVEGKFAQTAQQASRVRTLEYSKIGDRTAWAPPVNSLSQACGSAGMGDRNDGHNSLISDLANECALFNQGKTPDREVFVGALPPKQFRSFVAKPQFGLDVESQAKKKAHEAILDMASTDTVNKINKNCITFDAAATFLADLNSTLATNQISGADITRLAAEYQKTGYLTDQSYVKNQVNQALQAASSDPAHPATISGLSALYKTLFP
jgi:hypothetical protein